MSKLVCVLICLVLPLALSADVFVNGGFETGDWTGWIQGGGYWTGGAAPSPTTYLPGGSHYNMAGNRSAIVGVGNDPITGLPMVYNGNYSARINDYTNMYHVSVASQTVNNYTDPHIYFEWSAVLEESHTIGDSDYFALKLTDDTRGDTLYAVSYDSASTPGYFSKKYYSGTYSDWYYSGWQVQDLDVSSRTGDTFTLTVLGSDCPYSGHGGYVYVDGFAPVIIPPGAVPEPAAVVLLGTASLGIVAVLRKRHARRR
jgi:hypothetical protein